MKPATKRVVEAAAAVGLSIEVATFPEGTRTAAEAAAAIGCEVGAIAKSIVLMSDEGPLLVFTSGSNRVDYGKVAAVLGARGVRRATAEEAREATGYVIGGTAPFGHPQPLRTVMDRDLAAFATVWASAGTPHTVFAVSPQELQRTTGARPADVAAV